MGSICACTTMANSSASPPSTTTRRAETLKLILSGIPTTEICNLLSISPNTLKNHLQNIYRKLDVHNRIELVQKVMGMV